MSATVDRPPLPGNGRLLRIARAPNQPVEEIAIEQLGLVIDPRRVPLPANGTGKSIDVRTDR
jgi:hypothetical protein